MKEMTVNEALKLVKAKSEPAISLYVGTNVSERDGPGKIRGNLQRLYKTAEALVSRTHDARKRDRLLGPLKRALAALRLSRAKGGVAIYHTESFTGVVKIPTAVADLVVAADSFHLKPVLRAAQLRRTYYVLAFRKKYADLILVTADETKKVERIELHFINERPTGGEVPSRRWLKEGLKVRRQKDLRIAMETLNRQLESYLHGDRSPLLLAGPHHLQEAFRDSCSYQHLLERGMVGHIEDIDIKALGQLSTTIMEPYFAEIDMQALANFRKADAAGLGSTSLRQIAESAARGQVQSLLIAEDRQVWGHLDRENGTIRVVEHRSDATADDLLDDIAEIVLLKGGKVTVLPSSEMPSKQPIAAVMRWTDSYPQLGRQAYKPMSRPPGRETRVEARA